MSLMIAATTNHMLRKVDMCAMWSHVVLCAMWSHLATNHWIQVTVATPVVETQFVEKYSKKQCSALFPF